MTRFTKVIPALTIALIGAFVPTNSQASTLLDWGLETFDTATSLAWLDLTETNGFSVDAAIATHTTYRVATLPEVISFFDNADLPSPNQNNGQAEAPTLALIDLIGVTVSGSGTIGSQGFALGTGGTLYTDPFVGTNPWRTYRGLSDTGWMSSTTSHSTLGVFMVREASAPPQVPLPASGFLLLAGLFGLIGYGRKIRS